MPSFSCKSISREIRNFTNISNPLSFKNSKIGIKIKQSQVYNYNHSIKLYSNKNKLETVKSI